MKRFLFFLFSLLLSSFVCAQTTVKDGFYRVKNYGSGRYCYVTDNKGYIYTTSTTVDVEAIELWRGFDKAISDPATIIYIKKVNSQYDLQAQGTSTKKLIDQYVTLAYRAEMNAYKCGGTAKSMTKWLCDAETANIDYGYMCDGYGGLDAKYTYWTIIPVTTEDDAYFGVKPDFDVDGTYYKSMYASFPFSFSSAGMKAFYISKVWGDMAVISEVKDGMVPAETPVIITCGSADPSDNRLDIGLNGAANISGNLLSGNYFMRDVKGTHRNVSDYDATTMRLFGTTSDGKAGFVTSSEAYLPANSAYLKVPAGSPAELRLVTEEEFAAGITEIEVDATIDNKAIYNLSGVKVASGAGALEKLPAGIYIVGGKKVVKK